MSNSAVLALVPGLQPLLGDIPAWLPLGWIAIESGGRVSSRGMGPPLDERGLFQLTAEDSQRLGFDHNQVGTDPNVSLQAGIALINDYAGKLQDKFAVPSDDILWYLTKFRHGIGPGAADQIVGSFVTDLGRPPDDIDEFKDYAVNHPYGSQAHTQRWLDNADRVRQIGLVLSGIAGLTGPVTLGIGALILAGVGLWALLK